MQRQEAVERDKLEPRSGIPVEIQWLVEFLVENALDKVTAAIVSRCLTVVMLRYHFFNFDTIFTKYHDIDIDIKYVSKMHVFVNTNTNTNGNL